MTRALPVKVISLFMSKKTPVFLRSAVGVIIPPPFAVFSLPLSQLVRLKFSSGGKCVLKVQKMREM